MLKGLVFVFGVLGSNWKFFSSILRWLGLGLRKINLVII